MSSIEVVSLTGPEISDILPDLARLRIDVFRAWPYLYDGTLDYEEKYLATFAASKGAVCVVARDGKTIVGASTATPMAEHADEFGKPFEAAGYNIDEIFYCGESVLQPAYRGRGIGVAFFDHREDHAMRLGGFSYSTFCRVVRSDTHPLKPKDYVPLDAFWRKRGYAPIDTIQTSYDWKDVDQTKETAKPMQFWIKPLK